MHAPVVIDFCNVERSVEPKKGPSQRVLRSRQKNVSKTESSGSSSDTPQEECDSCGTAGNLVTCDGCFGAYHDKCFNSTEEDEELYCFECTASMNCSQGTSSPLSGQEIIEENFSANHSPKVQPKRSEVVAAEKVSPSPASPSKRKRKQPIKVCQVCERFGELIACIICEKTFHTYCVDLVHPTPHFKCPDHDDVDVIPREVFTLDFTPEKWRDEVVIVEDQKDSTLQKTWKKSRTEESEVTDILVTLKDAEAPEISPSILKSFTPKFIEFLAWQQLLQIHRRRNEGKK